MGLGDFLGSVFGSHTTEVPDVVKTAPNQALLNQQQAYADQLKSMAAGNGPSAATQMLQNQNDRNSAAALGMAAAQRGNNPALALRQALQANAAASQDAANQATTARMQEQLNAEGLLGGQLNTMQNQNLQTQLGNAQLNTGIATGNTNTNNQVTGGILGGLSSAAGALAGGGGKAHGGYIKSPFAQRLAGGGFAMMGTAPGQANPWADAFKFSGGAGGGGISNPLSGPDTQTMAGGPMDALSGALPSVSPAMLLASTGGKVPGKSVVQGDSPKNDIVPTMLSPDELVVPRSVSTKPKFIEEIEKIVRAMPGDGPQGFAKVLAARRATA